MLSSTRSTLLEHVGAVVESASTMQDFTRLLEGAVDTVAVCTSVPDNDTRVIVEATHASRPGTPVVGLQIIDYVKRPHVDVSIPGSPKSLQDEFRKLLNRAAHSNGA